MTAVGATARTRSGVTFALISAASFGLSGPIAVGLLDSGWSPGAAVTVRIGVAALVLIVPGVLALEGRLDLLRRHGVAIVVYGFGAVAGAQLCYFSAVQTLPVGVALLIEYTAPVAVVAWMWVVHRQRPSRLTFIGAAVVAPGLVLLLDVVGGGGVDVVGVAWALGAMAGAATYFVVSADSRIDLPPITLAAGGAVVGSATLAAAGLVGALPMRASTAEVSYGDLTLPWWAPIAVLGLVTAALAYVTGIVAGRRLGARLASFIALSEVVAAVLFAWLLLGQVPLGVQLFGAVVVGAGVIVVRLGERPALPRRTSGDVAVSERTGHGI